MAHYRTRPFHADGPLDAMSNEDYYDSDRYDSAAGWDGTSSGGRIVLAARGSRRAVDVDWLTGRVTVRAIP